MKSKHTPGPWKVEIATDLPLAVTQVNPLPRDAHKGCCVCEIDDWRPSGESAANALLISIAPNLLAVCQSIRDAIVSNTQEEREWKAIADQLKATLAEIEG